MRVTQLFSFIIALALLLPLISSVQRFDIDKYELTENSKEVEKRETESKDEMDEDNKFPISNRVQTAFSQFNSFNFSNELNNQDKPQIRRIDSNRLKLRVIPPNTIELEAHELRLNKIEKISKEKSVWRNVNKANPEISESSNIETEKSLT